MPSFRSAQLVALLVLASASIARAQEPATPAPAAALPAEELLARIAHAARRTGSIEIDGKLDDAAWSSVAFNDGFTQEEPDEGAQPTVQTRFKVLWDDEYLYIGIQCDDPELPVATLSRRDRWIEGDWVSVDLDTTFDRRTAYHFQVFAAGQQLDALHFNDTDMTTDWDAAWESKVALNPSGWSVEMQIPLRVLRIPEHATQFGFDIFRNLSRRHEQDQWRFQPRGRAGNISRLGVLDGLEGIHPVKQIELRPYVGARLTRNAPAPGRVPDPALGLCSSIGLDAHRQAGACIGLDFRYNLASDLSLVGTINPDFGQVEADQRVLNLSTFETFYPEKRPFFLEGLDLFKSPLHIDFGGPYGGDAYQLFYSRRIGRASPSASDLGVDINQLVYEPQAVPVLGAVKLSGAIGRSSVGLLAAFEPRVDAQLLGSDGNVVSERVIEERATGAARVRTAFGDNLLVGVTGTAVDPISTEPSLGLDGTHAHVGSADITLFNQDRSWNLTLQGSGSLLTGHIRETLLDGTQIGQTSTGWALSGKLSRETEHTVFAVNADRLSPTFTVDQLGYLQRANLTRLMGYFALRDPHQNDWRQSIQLLFGAREIRDAGFNHTLERDAMLELTFTTNAQWFVDIGSLLQAPYVDDRELQDGTPIERRPTLGVWGFVSTDARKRAQAQLSFTEIRALNGFERTNQLEATGMFRPLPQLDGSLDISYSESAGVFRQIRPASALPGAGANPTVVLDPAIAVTQERLYLLAPQQARSVSMLLRGTYAFTPYLTFQAYAQLFTAGVSYGTPMRAVAAPGKATIRLNQLSPSLPADLSPNNDDRQVGFNAQLVLRWEWRTGSTIYFVYAHQASNDIAPPLDRGLNFGSELGALRTRGVANGDTVLIKIDLLSAI